MQTNKPIRRHEAIVSYSRDHHYGLLLVWKIRQGLKQKTDSARIARYIHFVFQNDLDMHFRDEETNLFPLLESSHALRRRAERDHEGIRRLINGLNAETADPAELEKLASWLEEHIRFEERMLFAELQKLCPPSAWNELEKLREFHSSDIDGSWPDIFWQYK